MITVSAKSARELKKYPYIPVCTTLCTQNGPAERTIWYDTLAKDRNLLEIYMVKFEKVYFNLLENPAPMSLVEFLNAVQVGRFILVGIQPEPNAEVVA
jgi:hypothetical protein